MQKEQQKLERRAKRKQRIAAKVRGTASRPRLVVFRSNRIFSAQVIDDAAGKTILSERETGKNVEKAKELGTRFAAKLKEKKIATVIFDRGGYRYHGAVAAFAQAVREGGIQF